jgi:hypothetical protein
VHGRWLHARRVERKWRLVGSVGREVAGGRAAVVHVGPASRHRLEMLHTSDCCMCGAWKSGGIWQRSAGMATQRWRSRPRRCPNAVGLSSGYCSTGSGPIWCTVCFPVIETWHGARVDPSKQFLPLGPLPILNRIRVIKFGTTPL